MVWNFKGMWRLRCRYQKVGTHSGFYRYSTVNWVHSLQDGGQGKLPLGKQKSAAWTVKQIAFEQNDRCRKSRDAMRRPHFGTMLYTTYESKWTGPFAAGSQFWRPQDLVRLRTSSRMH